MFGIKRLSTYLKNFKLPYFIREILITACGILLAFLLNNWNETRKENNKEDLFLKEYSEVLQFDSTDLHGNIDAAEYWSDQMSYLVKYLNRESGSRDSLDFAAAGFQYIFFIPVSLAKYEELKQENFQLIKDDSLRSLIINYYEEKLYVLRINETQFNAIREDLRRYYTDHFTSWNSESTQPIDPNFVFNDHKYRNLVDQKWSSLRYVARMSKNTIEKISEIRSRIEAYRYGKLKS